MISRKFLASIVAALACLAALPSLASALTITVDDDRAQCPLADETTLTAAVAAAANGDSVKVCAGTYTVPGGPAPSSGLKIEKNISIAGAGADKVFVEPVQGTESMAQVAPNPRDEFGNVITVRRRLIELYDVSISGLTVRAGNVPVEAGITMTDVVTGTISGVKVEGIVPGTGPGTGAFEPPAALADHGQGIIVANTIEKTSNVTTITGSSVSGFNSTGILVDNRLLSGTGQVTNESFVTAKISNTAITGAGASSPIGQSGVEAWGSGARVQLTKSKISGVGKADASAAAVELYGADLANSVVGGSEANANDLTDNLYGATNVAYDGSPALAALNATANFWGTTVSADPTPVPLVGANVTTAPVGASAPAAPTIAAALDNLPTAQWDTNPANGSAVPAGVAVPLAVVAGDDFGVKQVEFKANGTSLGIAPTPALLGERVYSGSWTPTEAQAGSTVAITAVVTDSGGQTSQIALNVVVEGKPKFTAAPALTGLTSGYATIGKALTCSTGSTSGFPAPTYSYSWTVNAVAAGGTTNTYTPVAADAGKKVVCSVTATNKHGAASAASGQAVVASVPKFATATKLAGFSGSFALVGDVLTCAAGAATGDPAPTLSYVWKRGETTIGGATASSYTPVGIDVGSAVSCTITASSAGGSVASTASVNVGAAPSFAATAGTIGGGASGYALVGSTLTCTNGNPTGFPIPTVSYVWKADGLAAGVSATYVPGPADISKEITCTVKVTNSLGTAETTGSAVKIADPPQFTAAAEIGGATGTLAKVGDPLACSATAVGDPTPGLGYQWFRDAAAIAGANANTYTVEGPDEGHELTCEVTATSLAGSVSSSAKVGVGGPPSGGLPVLTGAAKVGSVLSCAPGTWAGIPKPAFTYQWLLNGAPIAGATSAGYTTTLADVGGKVTCEVSAGNELGSAKASSAELTVEAAPPAATPKAGGTVSGKFASLAAVTCDLGPCTVAGPKEVKVKIDGVTFKVKLVYPGPLDSGTTGMVKLRLSKAAKAALAKAGKSARFSVKLTLSGGGSSTTQAFGLTLKAPKK